MKLVDLRCEYLSDPMGIDVGVPRLSWKMLAPPDVRNTLQTACEIRAARVPERLARNQADLWNSGWVSSSASTLVPYGGDPLVSNQFVFWQVRVKDQDGRVSEWSETARFSMGLLSAEEWEGPWIYHPDPTDTQHIWFRKSFQLDQDVDHALIHVASLGYHELYVNGVRVGDQVLSPAVSRLDKRALYCSYELGAMLRPGKNTVAIWQGPGWARYGFFHVQPALRVQMHARLSDGAPFTLASNPTWRCAISISENTGPCKYSNNGGERIDARRHVADWHQPAFDDSGWVQAVEIAVEASLSAQMIEPTRILETIAAQSISREDTAYRVDMGKNFSGWLAVRMRGLAAGDEVLIQVANRDGEAEDFHQRGYFISAGEPEETFQHRFNYVAGRYVTITGLTSEPLLSDVVGYALSTDIRQTGAFASSHAVINDIYATDLWTYRANLVEGSVTDCPHRERMGYGEVAFACSWGIGFPNYDCGAFYAKTVRDWSDVQEENGWIHHTAPHVNRHYGGPMWSSAGLNVAWSFFQRYGDRHILELTYPSSKRWLEFLQSHVRDGLLRNYNEHWGKFLGDWAAPGQRKERGDSPEAEYFNNCVYALNLEYFIKIAGILGRADGAAVYGERLAALREQIHAAYYRPDQQVYCNGTQVQLAFALLAGVTPERLRPEIEASLRREFRAKGYLDMGSSGLPVLFKYMVEESADSGVLFDLIASEKEPSYGYFLARGETTWPEYWNVEVPSRIHTCYTGVSSWLTLGLAGIRPDPDCPGFRSFLIKPVMPEGLAFAQGSTESQYGIIRSRWVREDHGVRFEVTIPPNSHAKVFIPAPAAENISESGRPIDTVDGVECLGKEGDRFVLRVASGTYVFVAG
ncbi:MAG: family 78 glycoside hydrolase catalytic domain [Verrucomicrobia bacterium]|nr:family 78 glycoside hydrolase catalytic domain [Verrucomicrobiota bacterium]MCH8527828.1 glycoside hydrolase family 78 protein [Kiritimatiellia bacterium]